MDVRFRKPVPLGEPLDVYGTVTWHRRNVLGVEARVVDERGTILLEGEGKFVSMGPLDAVNDRRNVSR
jgi:acyl-CoA hydrolase